MADDITIGRMISRPVTRITEEGAFVDGGEHGELFVPRRQLPEGLKESDELKVFLYLEKGRVLATARRPYLQFGMVGRLKVTSIDRGTVYLDLGIPKELVVPISEQRSNFTVGQDVMVLVWKDAQERLFGTQRYNKYIKDVPPRGTYKNGQKAVIVPLTRTPLGFRAAVDDRWYGVLYSSDKSGEVRIGKRYDGYIKAVRPDGKLDLTLQEPGRDGIEHAASDILKALYNSEEHRLPFNDHSDPQEIEDYLHMSKGKFKKAIGHLYRTRRILIAEDGISLAAGADNDTEQGGSDNA